MDRDSRTTECYIVVWMTYACSLKMDGQRSIEFNYFKIIEDFTVHRCLVSSRDGLAIINI